MTRHERRRAAKRRAFAKALAVTNRFNTALVQDKVKANLSQPLRGKRTPHGLVSSIYSGTAKSVGFTNPDRSSRGVAK